MIKGPQRKIEESQQEGYEEAQRQAELVSEALNTGFPADAVTVPKTEPDRGVFRDDEVQDLVTDYNDPRAPVLPDFAKDE